MSLGIWVMLGLLVFIVLLALWPAIKEIFDMEGKVP